MSDAFKQIAQRLPGWIIFFAGMNTALAWVEPPAWIEAYPNVVAIISVVIAGLAMGGLELRKGRPSYQTQRMPTQAELERIIASVLEADVPFKAVAAGKNSQYRQDIRTAAALLRAKLADAENHPRQKTSV